MTRGTAGEGGKIMHPLQTLSQSLGSGNMSAYIAEETLQMRLS